MSWGTAPMDDQQRQAEEYQRWVSDTNIITYGGAAKVICPSCNETHAICRFQAGALTCVNDPCTNPHHRPMIIEPSSREGYL